MLLSGVFGTVEKFSSRRGAWVLFCGVWTYNVNDIEFQIFYELTPKGF